MPYLMITLILTYKNSIYECYKLFFKKTETDYLNPSLFFDYLQYPLFMYLFNTLKLESGILNAEPTFENNIIHPGNIGNEEFEDSIVDEEEFFLLGLSGEVNSPDEAAIFGRLDMDPDCDDSYKDLFKFDLDDTENFDAEYALDEEVITRNPLISMEFYNVIFYWIQISMLFKKNEMGNDNDEYLLHNVYNTPIPKEHSSLWRLNLMDWHYFTEKQSFFAPKTKEKKEKEKDRNSKFCVYPLDLDEKKKWSNYVPTIENDKYSNYQISENYLNVENFNFKKDIKASYYKSVSNYYVSYFITYYNRSLSKNYNINFFSTEIVNFNSMDLNLLDFTSMNLYYLAYEEKIINYETFSHQYQIFFLYGLTEMMELFDFAGYSEDMLMEYGAHGNGYENSPSLDLWPLLMNTGEIECYEKYHKTEDYQYFQWSEHFPLFKDYKCLYYGYSGKFRFNLKKKFFNSNNIVVKKNIIKNKNIKIKKNNKYNFTNFDLLF